MAKGGKTAIEAKTIEGPQYIPHLRGRSPESSNLSNIEHRAVIKYFVKKGKTPKEIFEDMVSVLQESAPSYTMIKKWTRYFKKDESCEDDPRPGRPVTAREAVVQKRRGKLSRGVLFLQDNASVHTARVSRQALKDTGFSEIDHPPYSPDLAPATISFFPILKRSYVVVDLLMTIK
ncbi:hypothetical protein EVAR_67011_1 [Eumeta japonica]|uniref:Mos1 transposase HTH domain-containing protein n=1 Tax=Eumeta variegata TaxID=151549 RepID=A0A4C1ZTF2_EUMVA|nr:hypothetical protein EVAR_67011_1 [Eumeta japonica]